jgi:hypothetical protein
MFHTVSDAAALAAAGAALNGSKVVSHTVTVNGNILAGAPINVSDAGTPGKTVSISGPPEGNAAITLGADGESLLNIRGCRVIMGGNLTLDGNGSQVVVNIAEGGTFSMSGGEIKGGLWYGVYIDKGGTFSMSGGEISGNSVNNVVVYNGGFTMSGGKIHDSNDSGVVIVEGSFSMDGGEIYDNYELGVYSWADEGQSKVFTMGGGEIYRNGTGVQVNSGTEFNMTSGIIYNNRKVDGEDNVVDGCGVDVPNGTFSMSGGDIYGNSEVGVQITGSGMFSMDGGEIYGNNNAGVLVYNGGFTMSGGKIHDSNNFGVIMAEGSFTMTGGEIYDNYEVGVDSWPAEGSPKLFTMGGGDIYGNGTGVRIEVGAEFNMTRGRIHENSGHGVDVPNGTFSMSGGEIYDNSGCGVEVPDGTFSMSGGEISYNNNAGVYIWGGGTFSMSSGDIHHNNNAGVRVNSSFHMAGGNIRDNIFQDSDSNYYNPGNLILWENCQSAVKTGGTINGGIYISGEDYIPKQEWTDDFSYPEQ